MLKILFFLTGFLMAFGMLKIQGLALGPFELLLLLSVAILAIRFLERKKIFVKIPPVFSMATGCIFLGFIFGIILSEEKIHALGAFLFWFILPFLLSLFLVLETKTEEKEFFAYGLSSGLLITALTCFLQRFFQTPVFFWQESVSQYLEQGRAVGFFNSPNALGLYALPAGLLSFHILKNKTRFLALALLALILLLGFSKGAIFGFLLGGLTTFLLFRFKRYFGRPSLFYIFIIFILAFSIFVASFGSLRREIWQMALKLIFEKPILGIGIDDFQDEILKRFAEIPNFKFIFPYAIHPHNLFLGTWLNLGLPGLIGVGIFYFSALKGSFETEKMFLLWLLISLGVHGMADLPLFASHLATLFFIGVNSAILREG